MLTETIDMTRSKLAKLSWPSLVVAAITLGCSLLVVLQPIDILVRHLKDDSFYYLKTANNIALGLGSTFDGINRTNGYHPLWMLNLIPIYALFPHAPMTALRVVVVIAALYHTIAAVTLYRLIARLHDVAGGLFISMAWSLSPFVLRIDLNGMESALYALLLSTLIYLIVMYFKDSDGHWIVPVGGLHRAMILGFLMALCVLARLDAIFICAGVMITVMFSTLRREGIRRCVSVGFAIAAPVVSLLGLYLLYNVRIYGHYYPVSGLIKRPEVPGTVLATVAQLLWPISPLYNRIGLLPSIVAVLVVVFSLMLMLFFSRLRAPIARTIRRYDWLFIGSVALYIYISLSKTFIANWYYVPIIFLITLLCADILGSLVDTIGLGVAWRGRPPSNSPLLPSFLRRDHLFLSGATLVLAILYLFIAASEFSPHKNDTIYESFRAAEWIKDNLSEREIGAAWNAGVLSYFSGRQIVNLDGLINSYDYYEAMKQGQEAEFVLRQGVSYVFDMYPVPDAESADDFYPGQSWRQYLKPYYEYRYYAHNVGFSSYFKTVFPSAEHDALFMFKVWRVVTPKKARNDSLLPNFYPQGKN